MSQKNTKKTWVAQQKNSKPMMHKEEILTIVKEEIGHLSKLSQKVSRTDMRANRIYLYELVEQFKTEDTVFIKPLIDDKYLEFPYARITMHDPNGHSCTVDWQRHNSQWVTLYGGTLKECLESIENDSAWF